MPSQSVAVWFSLHQTFYTSCLLYLYELCSIMLTLVGICFGLGIGGGTLPCLEEESYRSVDLDAVVDGIYK
jgi:hypothetical protein